MEIEIINSKAEEYAAKFSTPTDELLQEIEKFTMKHHPHANMLRACQGNCLK